MAPTPNSEPVDPNEETPAARQRGAILRELRGRISQPEFANRLGLNFSQPEISRLETGKRDIASMDAEKFVAYAHALGLSASDLAQRLGLEEGQWQSVGRPARIPQEVWERGLEELQAFRSELSELVPVPVFVTGAGPSSFDDESPESNLLTPANDKLVFGRQASYVRIEGKCMEPEWPEGWLALVEPDPARAEVGTTVLVWMPQEGRRLKRLVQWSDDGDHVLFQRNPPGGGKQVFRAPVGSVILGVATDLRRGRPPSVKLRELSAAIGRDMPELLDE
jgi:transcriptional regulator with XRE-family HTH domain